MLLVVIGTGVALAALISSQMSGLRKGMRSEVADLRSEIRAEIADLRSEIRAEIADLRSEIADLRSEINSLGNRVARLEGIFDVFQMRTKAPLPTDEVEVVDTA